MHVYIALRSWPESSNSLRGEDVHGHSLCSIVRGGRPDELFPVLLSRSGELYQLLPNEGLLLSWARRAAFTLYSPCPSPCPCPCPCPTAFVKLARARCPGRENLLRMSASLLPSTGVSTVTAIALNPAASALLMSCRVRARSLYRYSWNQCLPVGAAAATSSMEVVDRVDRPISTPRLAAALAVASSPSGCAMRCIAVGATQMGDETLSPRMVVLVSIFETSRSTLGRSLSLSKAALFSLNVVMSVAPLA
mmetsp:Transcript_11366/g.25550  ORF Transcript_11366/g.25550 Transcript_11366/m.25550 type:complete len:250 (-) Transcript_11366:164-913(-)